MDFVRPVQAVIPGAQGRILAVLAQTTAELSLTTLARLAGVSVAQASRVLPGLVALGLVERREVPPSSQFRLIREHVAVEAILALAGARSTALHRVGAAAAGIDPAPVSVIVFGSFARGAADASSDVDIVVVRDDSVDVEDEQWWEALEVWRRQVRSITGNDVELVEVSQADAARKLRGRSELWRDVRRDGVVVFGMDVEALVESADAELSA